MVEGNEGAGEARCREEHCSHQHRLGCTHGGHKFYLNVFEKL